MKTQNRILLSENLKAINEAKRKAEFNAYQLNSISKVFEFESANEFAERTKDIEGMVKAAMLARPEIKKLSASFEFNSLKTPIDIAEAREVLEGLVKIEGLFTNLTFNSEWLPDQIALDSYSESQRMYATGKQQIEKYEAAKALCQFLNAGEYGFAIYQKGEYHNVMIEWSMQGNWIVNNWWVVS